MVLILFYICCKKDTQETFDRSYFVSIRNENNYFHLESPKHRNKIGFLTQIITNILSWDLRAFDDDCPKVSLLSLKFYQEKCEEFLHNPPWMGYVFDGPDDGLLHLANTAWELIKIIWHFF